MDFLGLAGRTILVAGAKNKKSIAWHVGRGLEEAGARVIWSVHTAERAADLARLHPGAEIEVCDVGDQASIDALAARLSARGARLAGLVHSIAHAAYSPRDDGTPRAFHETLRADFLRAVDVSCFSLVALSNALAPLLEPGASVVALSISTTRMAAESYGYMAPVKAALDASVVFLAKSFAPRGVRFNALCAGPLKTSASAGIPGYLENYLYAEQATLRHAALTTAEVANVALFLLSPRSSGVQAQALVVDAGMGVNYFDRDLVRRATRPDPAP